MQPRIPLKMENVTQQRNNNTAQQPISNRQSAQRLISSKQSAQNATTIPKKHIHRQQRKKEENNAIKKMGKVISSDKKLMEKSMISKPLKIGTSPKISPKSKSSTAASGNRTTSTPIATQQQQRTINLHT